MSLWTERRRSKKARASPRCGSERARLAAQHSCVVAAESLRGVRRLPRARCGGARSRALLPADAHDAVRAEPAGLRRYDDAWVFSRRDGYVLDRKSTRLNSSHANISY